MVMLKLGQQAKRLTRELEQVKGFGQRNPYHWGYGVNSIEITYSASYGDYDNEDRGVRRRRHPRKALRDFKIEDSKFDENPSLENYIDWVQFVERIFEHKERMTKTLCCRKQNEFSPEHACRQRQNYTRV